MIVGAAGLGKTGPAREVLARAEASGERTSWIVGTESGRVVPRRFRRIAWPTDNRSGTDVRSVMVPVSRDSGRAGC